jgi:transposase-like protein
VVYWDHTKDKSIALLKTTTTLFSLAVPHFHQALSHCQRYQCKSYGFHFDDLTDTIFAGHNQPLQKWIGCLYLMELNLSSEQIAQELDLDKDDVYSLSRRKCST